MLDQLEYLDNLKRNGLGKSPSVAGFHDFDHRHWLPAERDGDEDDEDEDDEDFNGEEGVSSRMATLNWQFPCMASMHAPHNVAHPYSTPSRRATRPEAQRMRWVPPLPLTTGPGSPAPD